MLGAVFSINPLTSGVRAFSAGIFVGIIFVIYDVCRSSPVPLRNCLYILAATLTGQSIAALHTFLQSSAPEIVPRLFVGAMSESGQLALAIPVAVGLLIASRPDPSGAPTLLVTSPKLIKAYCWGAVHLALMLLCGFILRDSTDTMLRFMAAALVLVSLTATLLWSWGYWKVSERLGGHLIIASSVLPLLLAALLLNLKRGPWVGVIIGVTIVILRFRPRIVAPLALVVLITSLSITPIRDRLLAAHDHFVIAGGRSEMWEIGYELAARYPLGIGFKNSPLLRSFSTDIPPEHKHFHNNLLNILVETGWIGISVYLWWVIHLLRSAFRNASKDRSVTTDLAVAIGCGLLASQVAGLVEYNFGDSEVRYLVFLYCGALGALATAARSKDGSLKATGSGDPSGS
jgi:hypothetical protein